MGVYQNVFLGPYAEFPVPLDRSDELPPEDKDGELLCSRDLMCNWGYEDRHEDCYRYTPRRSGRKGPKRTMFFCDKGVCLEDQDLTDLDRQAEMDWFTAAYAKPLRVLTKQFGVPPRVRWGFVFWLS
jgi:hypothetical protein